MSPVYFVNHVPGLYLTPLPTAKVYQQAEGLSAFGMACKPLDGRIPLIEGN